MAYEDIMTPVRQKQLADIIKSEGFSVRDFELKPFSNYAFEIAYKTKSYFNIAVRDNKYVMKPAPGGESHASGESRTWDVSLTLTKRWIQAVKENFEIGNPWDEASSIESNFLSASFLNKDEVLTEAEQKAFEAKLDLLLDRISTQNLLTEQISSDINFLKESSKKFSGKELGLMFGGVFFSWMLGNLLPQHIASELWSYAIELFQTALMLQVPQ